MGDAAYKALHERMGLCLQCHRPAISGRRLCPTHLESNRQLAAHQKQRRREEGRCPSCGGQLHSEMDRGSHCIFCREKP